MNMFMEVLQGGPAAQQEENGPKRRRIWEADAIFRCPVAGMCLSIREQRQLCRKVGAPEHAKTDFAVHEMVVSTMDGENPLSRKLESLLARKYEAACREYLAMSEERFLEAWRAGLRDGDYLGLLWTAAVRVLSHAATVEVFGTLHMAMHEHAKAYRSLAETARAAVAKADGLRAANVGLEKAVRSLTAEKASLAASLEQSRRALEQAGQARADATEVPAPHGDAAGCVAPSVEPVPVGPASTENAPVVASLEERIACLELEAERREAELQGLRDRHLQLEAEHGRLSDEYAAHLSLDAAMRKACAGEACRGQSCTPECPSFDLCEKRVLIVGGIERMEKSYREFVEKRGGTLEYHSGHMKSGGKALERSVQRADLVLCPVNCNSHGACIMVKNLGKKYRKPVQMLKNYSLSAIARAVDDMHAAN
jgi:hypothetical protein